MCIYDDDDEDGEGKAKGVRGKGENGEVGKGKEEGNIWLVYK